MLRSATPVRRGHDPHPERLAAHDRSRFRGAATYARLVLPGAVGELVARELDAHADFGWRFQSDALIVRLAREVLAMRRPDPALSDPPRRPAEDGEGDGRGFSRTGSV